MNPTYRELAVPSAEFGALGVLVGGLVVVGVLVWAVRFGIRVRGREPGPPEAHEHPRLPASGPVRETREMREPDEVPRAGDGGDRLTPARLRRSATRRSDTRERPRRAP